MSAAIVPIRLYSVSPGAVWRKWSPALVSGVSIRSCHDLLSRCEERQPDECVLVLPVPVPTIPIPSPLWSSAEEWECVDSLEKWRPCLGSGNGLDELTWRGRGDVEETICGGIGDVDALIEIGMGRGDGVERSRLMELTERGSMGS